jgi:hypothetical protein
MKISESVHIAQISFDKVEAIDLCKWPMSAHVIISYVMSGLVCESFGNFIGLQFVLVLA